MSKWDQLGQRVVELTEKLVRIHSVVDEGGEGPVAEFLHGYLNDNLPPEFAGELKLVNVEKDKACKAVIAFLPAVEATEKTIVLMGHIDTVGLESFGGNAGIAFDSEALKDAYKVHDDPRIAEAAADPDWAFGRGWLDMKGGVAVIVELFLREARRRKLRANLVLLLTPDEESESRGVRTLIPELIKLKDRHGLKITQVFNTDYTSPIFPGDQNRYFYSGVVGKLLIGISVFGRTTHVGETFNGLNSSALAGYLGSALEHDHKLMQGTGGEWLPPPTLLRVADRRSRYDVMTIDCAEAYVNMFHLGGNPKKLWGGIVNEVRRLNKRYDRALRLRYNRFVARADLKLPRYGEHAEVIDYRTLVKRVAEGVDNISGLIDRLEIEAHGKYSDLRERGLHIVRGLHAKLPQDRPMVVVSLLQPFYPAQLNQKGRPDTAALIGVCRKHGLKHRRVYPYIADLSYFCFSEETGIRNWERQSPVWFNEGEVGEYEQVSSRVCNIGPWGVGAHRFEERVYLPFLRDKLPRIVAQAMDEVAGV